MERPVVWTIGHSNHELGAFAGLLSRHEIAYVVDVRSYPYSRYAQHFSREALRVSLRRHGIGYLFLGEQLGGRPGRPEHYDDSGHALYGPMADEPSFQQAIDRVAEGARAHRLALLCSEARPEHCHRRLLVGRVLTDRGVELRHVLPDGSILRETAVALATDAQSSLFGQSEPVWRSTQSVSHRRRLSGSSVV